MTLEQLIERCDKIRPYWCACGICSLKAAGLSETSRTEIIIDSDGVRKVNDDVSCSIK